MNISLFEVLGPVMIGPSSSHTAGAAKLARVARIIAEHPFHRVTFGLYGSFAKTGVGHGTRQALLAGAMGFQEDDERIKNIEPLAAEAGMEYEFYDVELDDAHENTAVITFYRDDGEKTQVTGCSVGGGRIKITDIDGLAGQHPRRGAHPAHHPERQARRGGRGQRPAGGGRPQYRVMRVSRVAKGDIANCVIETDGRIGDELVRRIRQLPNVRSVRAINI